MENKIKKEYAKLLCSTLGSENDNYSLDHIYIEDSIIVSTNGTALTAIKFNGTISFDNGLYLLKGNSLFRPVVKQKFPDWKSIIPKDSCVKVFEHTSGSFTNKLQWVLSGLNLQISISDNLKTIKAMESVSDNWTIEYNSPSDPVLFCCELVDAKVKVMLAPFGVN